MKIRALDALKVSDIDELASVVVPWELEMSQLSAGAFSADLQVANVDGVLLSREFWSQRVLSVGATPPDYFLFGTPDAGHRVIFAGEEAHDVDLIWSVGGVETEFVIQAEGTHFAVLFPMAMVEQALFGRPDSVFRGPRGVVRIGEQKAEWLRLLIADAMAGRADTVLTEADVGAGNLLGAILAAVERNGPPGRGSRRTSYLTCSRAIGVVKRDDSIRSVQQLAAQTGVSLRLLELAFKENLGLTPFQFLSRARLSRLHAELRTRGSVDCSVTSIMLKHGFTELGRTAGRYRELFSEKPSATLAQRPAKTDLTFARALAGWR